MELCLFRGFFLFNLYKVVVVDSWGLGNMFYNCILDRCWGIGWGYNEERFGVKLICVLKEIGVKCLKI